MSWVMGSEVDKLSKNFIKTSNAVEYIESDIQNIEHQEEMILSSKMCEKTFLLGIIEGVPDVGT